MAEGKQAESTARASDPGQLRVSDSKVRDLHPELYERKGLMRFLNQPTAEQKEKLQRLASHLQHGDSRAAVVVSGNPLVVAAYTDELDCVALLRFPDEMARAYQLQPGSRLLTLNSYGRGTQVASDLLPGPACTQRWTNFCPVIAEFVSDDVARIGMRKAEISEEEWARTWEQAQAYSTTRGLACRDGRPLMAHKPAPDAAQTQAA